MESLSHQESSKPGMTTKVILDSLAMDVLSSDDSEDIVLTSAIEGSISSVIYQAEIAKLGIENVSTTIPSFTPDKVIQMSNSVPASLSSQKNLQQLPHNHSAILSGPFPSQLTMAAIHKELANYHHQNNQQHDLNNQQHSIKNEPHNFSNEQHSLNNEQHNLNNVHSCDFISLPTSLSIASSNNNNNTGLITDENEVPEIKYADKLNAMKTHMSMRVDGTENLGEFAINLHGLPDSTSPGCSSMVVAVSDPTISSNGDVECGQGRRGSTSALSDRRPHLLPPCKVCGSQATGFHYGVNTCEACKGFFRRCLLRNKETMHCMKGEKCIIRPGRRNLCVLCRYQKCLQAGMSVQGIKTGRYTYKKRTEDIIELQKLRQKECAVINETSVHAKQMMAMETARTVMRSQEKNLEESLQSMHILYQKGRDSPEHFAIKEQPKDESVSFESSNSLSSNPSKEQNIKGLFRSMEKSLVAVVKFARDLPEFKVLPLADQMKIFKSSTLEVWLIARHQALDVGTSKFSTVDGYTVILSEVVGLEFYEAIKRAVLNLQKLNLTPEETVILKALAYFFTDRCELSRPDLVEEGQAKIVSALEVLLHKNHPDDPLIFAKVIGALALLREPSEMFHGKRANFLQFIDSSNVPLMYEVLKPLGDT